MNTYWIIKRSTQASKTEYLEKQKQLKGDLTELSDPRLSLKLCDMQSYQMPIKMLPISCNGCIVTLLTCKMMWYGWYMNC